MLGQNTKRRLIVAAALMAAVAITPPASAAPGDPLPGWKKGPPPKGKVGPPPKGPIMKGPSAKGPVFKGPIPKGPIAKGPIAKAPIIKGPIAKGPPPPPPGKHRPWRSGLQWRWISIVPTVILAQQLGWCHYHAYPTAGMEYHRSVRCHRHARWNHPSLRYVEGY